MLNNNNNLKTTGSLKLEINDNNDEMNSIPEAKISNDNNNDNTSVMVSSVQSLNVQPKLNSSDTGFTFHVPQQYSLHEAKSPSIMTKGKSTSAKNAKSFHFSDDTIDTLYSIYKLIGISKYDDDKRGIEVDIKKYSISVGVYYSIVGLSITYLVKYIYQIIFNKLPKNYNLILICSMLWFIRHIVIYVYFNNNYFENETDNSDDSQILIESNSHWIRKHLRIISSSRAIERAKQDIFIRKSLYICCGYIIIFGLLLLGVLILNSFDNSINIGSIDYVYLNPFPKDNIFIIVGVFATHLSIQIIWIIQLPLYILSTMIVSNRFIKWKNVITSTNHLKFYQIRSYVFNGRYLITEMNKQWSFYLSIIIFTSIPNLLMSLFALVLHQSNTSLLNQVILWLCFIFRFIELSVVLYYGALVHEKFDDLIKSIVDLGSRTFISGDEKILNSTKAILSRALSSTSKEEQTNFYDYNTNNDMNNNNNNNNTHNIPNINMSIQLLLLLTSSTNTIDGLSIYGVFTLSFKVIAKFLSALFTFVILFIELKQG